MSNKESRTITTEEREYIEMLREIDVQAGRDHIDYLKKHGLYVPESELAISCECWDLHKFVITPPRYPDGTPVY